MWNFQQSLQNKQVAEGLMFLICLIQKPAKMTHFKNNNKPCQIFNHNKESEGWPIYFFFYTLHLLAWPERHAQMPAICSSTEWSPGRLPPWLPTRTARPGWWNSSLLAEAVDGGRLGAGLWRGCIPSTVSALLCCLCFGRLDCPSPTHSSKGKCLKQGEETKDLQDSMGKHWTSLPSLLRWKSIYIYFPLYSTLCNNLGKMSLKI